MNVIDRLRAYFRDSKTELVAVSWPTRQDIIRYTILVVVTVVAFGAFFSVLDLGLNSLSQLIISNRRNATQTQNTQTPTTEPATSTPINVNPVDVQAVSPSGTPAEVKVEQVPIK